MSLYTQALIDAGFTKHQAAAYTYLVEHGPTAASVIARHSGISRTLMYRVLDDLIERGLVVRDDPDGAVSTFSPAHPVKLHEYIEARRQEAERAAESVASVVDGLTSEYNKRLGKPGVRFFEGPEGVEYVLQDSLNASTEILAYANIEAILAHIPEINERYVEKRAKRGIQKRGILLDTPRARALLSQYHRDITTDRLIQASNVPPFESIMNIYNNTVAYVTLAKERMIGVIIDDARIATMHRYTFECLWHYAGTEVVAPTDDARGSVS